MQVLFSGDSGCSQQTLKRLIVLADEVAFMDRPSITLSKFGTLGTHSIFRQMDVTGLPIKIAVHEPPSGPASDLYLRYFDTDVASPAFRKVVWRGLAAGGDFCRKLIKLDANYGWGTGHQVREALLADATLLTTPLDEELGPDMYKMDIQAGRNVTFKVCLFGASIQVTTAIVVAESSGLCPVTDDPFICELLALRSASEEYVHKPTPIAAMLGLSIAKSVLPDEMLAELPFPALFEYRHGSKDVYAAWSAEVERLALKLQDIPPDKLDGTVANVIASEVQPKLTNLTNELAYARDKLFGDMASKVTQWQVPTMSVAYLAGASPAAAIAAFAGALAAPVVPPLIDYFVKRRDINRRNSMAYLIGLSDFKVPEG